MNSTARTFPLGGDVGGQDPDALATAPSGMAGISMADDVAAVSDVVRRAAELDPVILVGTILDKLAR